MLCHIKNNVLEKKSFWLYSVLPAASDDDDDSEDGDLDRTLDAA